MLRSNKPASAIQKCYDDCYLICSTAIYFESKNNESEALRSWRSALDQIYYNNAYRVPSGWRPRSETERALQESLRQMELQCKERVDLLEALRESREEKEKEGSSKEGSTSDAASLAKTSTTTLPLPDKAEQTTQGWIGGGTVPPVDYPDLSRPPTLPARSAPKRPSYTSKKSSTSTVHPVHNTAHSSASGPLSPPLTSLAPPHALDSTTRTSSRTPSPDKKGGMLRTLRAGGKERSSSAKMATSLRSRPPAAARAATQAWGTSSKRTSVGSAEHVHADLDGSAPSSNATWDFHTRSLVERPPSREPQPGASLAPAVRDHVVRTPSPSEHYSSRHEDQIDYLRRPSNQPPAYHEDPPARSIQSSRSFTNSMENMSVADQPESTHAPTKSTMPSSTPNTRLRRQSPPRVPKHEVVLPAYRKEYLPAVKSKYKKPPNAAPPRQHDQPSYRDEPEASTSVKSPTKPRLPPPAIPRKAVGVVAAARERQKLDDPASVLLQSGEETGSSLDVSPRRRKLKSKDVPDSIAQPRPAGSPLLESDSDPIETSASAAQAWQARVAYLVKNLPAGVDEAAAKQILNEIVIQGDEVHWDDVAGLEIAKSALKETVVYPFLRPDLFMGLREPARGMLLFGPPGTGKTMLARAVATESRSTFFAISASSLTSKYLGESEKLVRALFSLAKALAPSIIFVDEIDSLLSSRGGGSEHEATRRIKTEFLIQWSDLAKAAAGRETSERDKERGDASRVLVLAATNLPWAIDEAARRRFVRRQYIPLPEDWVRKLQLHTLLSHQKHQLGDRELDRLVLLTEGFSGSDITALAKDAAMGPLRSLGERLLHMSPDEIRSIQFKDFQASLVNIRPSVSKEGLKQFEDWAKDFGERGG